MNLTSKKITLFFSALAFVTLAQNNAQAAVRDKSTAVALPTAPALSSPAQKLSAPSFSANSSMVTPDKSFADAVKKGLGDLATSGLNELAKQVKAPAPTPAPAAHVKALAKGVTSLQTQSVAALGEHQVFDAQLVDLNKGLSALQESMAGLQKQLADLGLRLNGVEGNVTSMGSTVTDQSAQFTDLSGKMNSLQATVKANSASSKEGDGLAVQLKGEVDELKNALESLTQQVLAANLRKEQQETRIADEVLGPLHVEKATVKALEATKEAVEATKAGNHAQAIDAHIKANEENSRTAMIHFNNETGKLHKAQSHIIAAGDGINAMDAQSKAGDHAGAQDTFETVVAPHIDAADQALAQAEISHIAAQNHSDAADAHKISIENHQQMAQIAQMTAPQIIKEVQDLEVKQDALLDELADMNLGSEAAPTPDDLEPDFGDVASDSGEAPMVLDDLEPDLGDVALDSGEAPMVLDDLEPDFGDVALDELAQGGDEKKEPDLGDLDELALDDFEPEPTF